MRNTRAILLFALYLLGLLSGPAAVTAFAAPVCAPVAGASAHVTAPAASDRAACRMAAAAAHNKKACCCCPTPPDVQKPVDAARHGHAAIAESPTDCSCVINPAAPANAPPAERALAPTFAAVALPVFTDAPACLTPRLAAAPQAPIRGPNAPPSARSLRFAPDAGRAPPASA
jgi:hypothetical protein